MFYFKRVLLNSLLLGVLFSTCERSKANECKLANALYWENTGLAYPPSIYRVKSTGTLRLGMIFVDYNDAQVIPSNTNVAMDLYRLFSPLNENWFSAMSYNRLQVQITPHLHWLRSSKLAIEYGDVTVSYEAHKTFIRFEKKSY
jgi:hypothetical protein